MNANAKFNTKVPLLGGADERQRTNEAELCRRAGITKLGIYSFFNLHVSLCATDYKGGVRQAGRQAVSAKDKRLRCWASKD